MWQSRPICASKRRQESVGCPSDSLRMLAAITRVTRRGLWCFAAPDRRLRLPSDPTASITAADHFGRSFVILVAELELPLTDQGHR